MGQMKRAALDGVTLEYEVSGAGEPVVFVPGAGHLLHLENGEGMAEGLASFFGRHSLSMTV